jgi:predicted amidohydrolase YtcJ
VLRETAAGLLDGIGARAGGATLAELARLADREVLSKGTTSFQDAGSSFETIESLAALAEAGELGVRLWVMVRDSPAKLAGQLARARRIGAANHPSPCAPSSSESTAPSALTVPGSSSPTPMPPKPWD